MPPRSIAAALALITGACFHDEAPRDLSATFTGTSTAMSTDATGPAVTTGAASEPTTSSTSTGAVDPTSSTTDATTDATTTTMPETSMTSMTSTTMTMTSMTMPETTTIGPVACGDTKLFECYKCCAEAHAGALTFYAELAACACPVNCKDICKNDLCVGTYPSDGCLLCAGGMDQRCAIAANAACNADPQCVPFLDCVAAVPCM